MPLLFYILCKTRVLLLDEAGRKAELQQRDGERRGKIVEVGTDFGELNRFDGLIEELMHSLVELVIEQFGFGHRNAVSERK